MPASFVHLDADAFFASVEQAADRRLRGRPVAVGGRRRGIIACASYEARARGVYTPMPSAEALRICPDLVLLPGHFSLYEEFSANIFGLCEEITPLVEKTSIDEGYLDLSPTRWGSAPQGIREMNRLQEEIQQWMKITVSQGLAGNKLVSQIASKLHKPRGFVVVPPGREATFLRPLPLHHLPGLGPQTIARLQDGGFFRIEDLLAVPPQTLQPLLGSRTEAVRQMARGEDDRRLLPERPAAQSLSQQESYETDQGDEAYILRRAKHLLSRLLTRLRESQQQARTLHLQIRYTDRETAVRSLSLEEPTNLPEDFHPRLPALLKSCWSRRVRVRTLCLRLSNFYRFTVQQNLWPEKRDRRQTLARAVDAINRTYGPQTIRRAYEITDTETTPQPGARNTSAHQRSGNRP